MGMFLDSTLKQALVDANVREADLRYALELCAISLQAVKNHPGEGQRNLNLCTTTLVMVKEVTGIDPN